MISKIIQETDIKAKQIAADMSATKKITTLYVTTHVHGPYKLKKKGLKFKKRINTE